VLQCNILQLTATNLWRSRSKSRCNSLQHTTAYCNKLQHTATHLWRSRSTSSCNSLQLTGIHWKSLQPTATRCNPLQPTALQLTAVYCSILNVRSYPFWKLTQLPLLVPNLSLLNYFDITLSRHKSSKIEGSGPPIKSHSIQFHCVCFHFSTVSKRETVYTRCHMKGVHIPSHLQSFAGA